MNITLIGMPGAGKSLIGRALAEALNYRFIDLDSIIEKKTKLKLQKLIDACGEDKFLKIEENTVLKLGLDDKNIISPGGSVVYSKKAMEFLKKNTTIVFLSASFKSINKRISDEPRRGIINLKGRGMKQLFSERTPLYRKYADTVVRLTENYNINIVVKKILKKVFKP